MRVLRHDPKIYLLFKGCNLRIKYISEPYLCNNSHSYVEYLVTNKNKIETQIQILRGLHKLSLFETPKQKTTRNLFQEFYYRRFQDSVCTLACTSAATTSVLLEVAMIIIFLVEST